MKKTVWETCNFIEEWMERKMKFSKHCRRNGEKKRRQPKIKGNSFEAHSLSLETTNKAHASHVQNTRTHAKRISDSVCVYLAVYVCECSIFRVLFYTVFCSLWIYMQTIFSWPFSIDWNASSALLLGRKRTTSYRFNFRANLLLSQVALFKGKLQYIYEEFNCFG